MKEPYSFPGLRPFVEEAADRAGLDDPALRARAATGPNADAVATALSQVVEQARRQLKGLVSADTVGQVFARAESTIKVLDVQASALKAAMAEVKAAFDDGSYVLPPEPPKPRRAVEPVEKPPLPLAPPIQRPTSNPPESDPRIVPAPDDGPKPRRRKAKDAAPDDGPKPAVVPDSEPLRGDESDERQEEDEG